jgi:formylglycine-generating enzyme required for sulfatase activity
MMASLQFSWGRLPDDRVELYAEMVRLLLVRWQEARLGQESGVTQTISMGNLESALERVAFVAHRQQTLSEGTADIGEALLLSVFKDYFDGSWDRARDLVHYIRDRAGLLIDRGSGAFAFPHRSYQEYLAGSYLAVQPEFPDETAALVRDNYPQWREVALWATGAMTRQKKMPHIAVDLAAALCSREDPPAQAAPIEWRMAHLAGDVLREIGLLTVLARERHQPVAARVQRWLLALVQRGALAPSERAEAGVTLGFLGDPRFAGPYSLPDFVAIPGGTFWMGSEQAEVDRLVKEKGQDWYQAELPRHQVELSPFAIACYPTTKAMFQCFVEAGGYRDERWWAEARSAKVWRKDGTINDAWGDVRTEPRFWGDARLNGANQPVVGVTWYEAVAYCRWLTAALDDGHAYRLPTEAEWERAARGQNGWRYPWGDEWSEGRANSEELALERTTPVGIFPDGASGEGVLDLSGNVWEWCSDWYGERTYVDRAKRVERDPKGPARGNTKVLRGGSYGTYRTNLRCAYRLWFNPDDWNVNNGFRVARGSLT